MRSLKRKEKSREFFIDALIFRDVEFRMYYIKYLKEFSSEQYLDSCFLEFENEISINEKLLGSEMLSYKFKKSFYYKRSLLIHDEFKILDSLWDAYMLTPIIPKQISSVNYHPNKTNFYIEEVSINAYRQKLDSANYQIDLENYHLNDIKIIGYTSRRTQDTIHYLKKPILMKGYKNISSLDTKTFLITQKPKEIVFEIKNDTSRIFKKSFLKWQKPIGTTAVMDAEKIFKLNNTLYNVNGNQITFKAGKLTVKELIVFPPKFSIHIYSGTTINFINGGGLVVNNSINIIGTEADSVKFISTDKNNNGLTILNGENVKMEYVSFINIQALHYKTWNLTGAVTIYETDANLKHVYIGDNDSEDALNIIRSNFIIENLRIENTVSDGFDADFCSGEIINSIFKNTGNDCIDFSGSKVSIENIDIQKSGDKGISGGEKSELFIKEISIDGAITGVASKDGSIIKGDEVSIKNTEYGFAAFKKKPEYNVAKIEITKVDMENIETNEVLIDLNSQIILNGKLFLGKVKLDIDQMYARFEK